MVSLREWLIAHGWFILFCDPGPTLWCIRAIAPNGRRLTFDGDKDVVRNVSASDDYMSPVI